MLFGLADSDAGRMGSAAGKGGRSRSPPARQRQSEVRLTANATS